MGESTGCPDWIGNYEELERWLSGYEMGSFYPDNAVINTLAPVQEGELFARSINEFSAILNPKGETRARITFEYITNEASEISTFYKDSEARKSSFTIKQFNKEIPLKSDGEENITPGDGKVRLILKFRLENGKLTIVMRNLANMSDYKKEEYKDKRIFEWIHTAYCLKVSLKCEEGFSTLPSKLTSISYHAKDDILCKPYNIGYIIKSRNEIQLNSLQVFLESRYIPWILAEKDTSFVNLSSAIIDSIVINNIKNVLDELEVHASKIKSQYKDRAGDKYQEEYESDLALINDEIGFAKKGMIVLEENPDALWAFKFLNDVMSEKYKDGKWWPFQLIFILIMISKYFHDNNKKSVALLNFPTGMGKTEAFMGYTLWLSTYLRRTGNNFGNVAIIKYPRVMLSKQQANRAISLFSYANKRLLKTDLPKHPFSVGVLYAEGDTPNKILSEDTKLFSPEFLKLEEAFKGRGKPGFSIERCPVCVNGVVKPIASKERGRILYICQDPSCDTYSEEWESAFYREKGEIPVYITDDEVFRYVPTVILTTTYKFASFCTSGRWKTLLGKSSRGLKSDTKFGYYFYEKDEEDVGYFNRNNNCSWFSGKKISMATNSPSLIIIDETHLITGSQASLLGPVETAFLDIFKNNEVYPQIISSSATVNKVLINPKERSYQQHMAQLFGSALENVMLFPSSLEIYEDSKLRKQRVITAFYPSKYTQLFGLEKVSSFIFTKVSSETNTHYRVPVFYFDSKAEMSIVRRAMEERVAKSVRLTLMEKFKPFSGDMDPGLIYSQLEEVKDMVLYKKGWAIILATNIIANGIDSDILNTIVFNGLPKGISEYVQARSRTARHLEDNASVIIVLSRANPREKAFHESFYQWHTNQQFLYDESPVNKYSDGVINETIPRVFHLYAFWKKDGNKKSEMVYKKDVMAALIDNILSGSQGDAADMLAQWIVSPIDRARMNADIKTIIMDYLKCYKDILHNRNDSTIYDFTDNPTVPNKCLPRVSLLQVSDRIDIVLSYQGINDFERAIGR